MYLFVGLLRSLSVFRFSADVRSEDPGHRASSIDAEAGTSLTAHLADSLGAGRLTPDNESPHTRHSSDGKSAPAIRTEQELDGKERSQVQFLLAVVC